MKIFIKNTILKVPFVDKMLVDYQQKLNVLEKNCDDLSQQEKLLKIQLESVSDEKYKIEQERDFFEKEKDHAYGGCGVRDEEMHWLKISEENLKKELTEVNNEINRVYSGHNSLMEEISFLKFRNIDLSLLHEDVVLRNWEHDDHNKKHMCKYPFERMEILSGGEVYTCCSSYINHNYYIGNIFTDTFNDVWNSEKAQKLRYSVSEGNFEYCNKHCKWLHVKDNNENSNYDSAQRNPLMLRENSDYKFSHYSECIMTAPPKSITLTCDESCNLTCPSCRSSIKVISKEASDNLYDTLMNKIRPLLGGCELLGALGSGDVFASKAVSKFLQSLTNTEFPNLEIYLLTNAQLLTKEKWNEFQNLQEMSLRIGISIDACQQESYEILRRGGRWDILLNNLTYIAELKEKGLIKFLIFQFVVQKENYLQMEGFVEFAKHYKADAVEFQLMGNWGTFQEDEFIEINVFDSRNKNYNFAVDTLKGIIANSADINIIQNIL